MSEVKDKTYPVMELFGPTIQGEGPLAGRRHHFVRFGGCPYRCTWCDTMYAVDPQLIKAHKKMMSAEQILTSLSELPPSEWVCLTGGDPVMWDLFDLVSHGDFKFSVETEGYLWQDWLYQVQQVVVSPKPPSSGMAHKFDREIFLRYATLARAAVKVVIFNTADLDWTVNTILPAMPVNTPLYLSVGTDRAEHEDPSDPLGDGLKLGILNKFKWLTELVLKEDRLRDAIILPQLHVLCWGEERGV